MKKTWILGMVLACCLLAVPASAEESTYCFRETDLGEELAGIRLRNLPEEGELLLGRRSLRPGDAVPAEQISALSYVSGEDLPGEVTYLAVTRDGALETASFLIPGRKNLPPVAEDSLLETYQNIPNSGLLRVRDPEQKPLKIVLVKEPKRGTVTLEADGKFTYTPKKNKVGTDSFTYAAEDPEGERSREATVTVTILKPSEGAYYRDTGGLTCEFSAAWMRNAGIFSAEAIGDACCFQPEKPVSRGEFLTMLLKTLEIPPEAKLQLQSEQIPRWLQPYAAAALRSGLTAGLPAWEDFLEPVTVEEAARMLQNALDRPVPAPLAPSELPAWGDFSGEDREKRILTRGETAELLYQVHLLRQGA